MKEYLQNTLILTREPFIGFMPEDVTAWLEKNQSDADLALTMAEINNHGGRISHNLDEYDDPWLDYASDKWWELEEWLYAQIITRMRDSSKYHLDPNIEGLYNKIRPFMEANGYRDGSGWWIKEK